jgi:hypothetical protein
MALQYSIGVRNARLDVVETTVGTAPVLRIFSGTLPANCAAANSGTVLATCTLPSDWMGAASAGVKSLSGSWADSAADATGTAVHFRIHDSAGTNCHIQGTVGTSASDMIVDNTSFATGQAFSVTSFTLTAGNA